MTTASNGPLTLSGKPIGQPRGRHARKRVARRKIVAAIPVNQRLGFRVEEWAALTGVSDTTVWRSIKDGRIDVVEQNGLKIIPRAYAIRAGYITADDSN